GGRPLFFGLRPRASEAPLPVLLCGVYGRNVGGGLPASLGSSDQGANYHSDRDSIRRAVHCGDSDTARPQGYSPAVLNAAVSSARAYSACRMDFYSGVERANLCYRRCYGGFAGSCCVSLASPPDCAMAMGENADRSHQTNGISASTWRLYSP